MRLAIAVVALCIISRPGRSEAAPAKARFPRPTTLATHCSYRVAATDRAVYWDTETGVSMRMLPDGPTKDVVQNTRVRDLLVSSDEIWFVSTAGIERVAADGSRTLVTDRPASAFTVDDQAVYWIELRQKYEIWSVLRSGGTPRLLGEDTAETARMVASGDRLYMITSASGVSSVPTAGGTVEQVARQAFDLPLDIAANRDRVVWASGPSSTIEQIMAGRDTILFEDQRVETNAVAVTPDGRVVFAAKKDRGWWQLQLMPAGVGTPAPKRRDTDTPVGNAKRAKLLIDLGRGGYVPHIAVNAREVFWLEIPYDTGPCVLRALTLR